MYSPRGDASNGRKQHPHVHTVRQRARRNADRECAAFDQLDEELLEYYIALADDAGRDPGRIQPHGREDEYEALLSGLCRHRAQTLAGLAARTRTLLRCAPERFELHQALADDELLTAALLRDLASVLQVDNA